MNTCNVYDLLCVSDLWHGMFNNSHHHFPRPLKVVENHRGDQKPNSKEAKCEDSKTPVNVPLCLSSYFPKPNIILKIHAPIFLFLKNLLISLEREEERERSIDLLFHLFMHQLVDSCMCPDWESNLHLGVSEQCSNQLSYPARALFSY